MQWVLRVEDPIHSAWRVGRIESNLHVIWLREFVRFLKILGHGFSWGACN